MLNTPFQPWPVFSAEDIHAAKTVLESGKVNYWTGTECREFEKEFAIFAGTKFAVALANGTVALELALRVLGIGSGDEVIVPSRTFVASASCVVAVGATPIFADVDRDSQNVTADTISSAISSRTRAVICVHLAGWPCDMDPILSLAKERGIFVIEDCAQAHGAEYKGRPVGGLGDIAAWSFCQDKIISTAGEGGMLTLNNYDWWSAAWSYKDHGKSYDAVRDRPHQMGFRWVHDSFGTNWRMTEVQAAIGRIQLRKLSEWNSIRARNAKRIWETCRNLPLLRVPPLRCASCGVDCPASAGCQHAHYKCYVFVRPEKLGIDWSRDRIVEEINREGVPCYHGSCSEIYLEQSFVRAGLGPKQRLQVAKELGETSLMFLVHPTLLEQEIHETCVAIRRVIERASTSPHLWED